MNMSKKPNYYNQTISILNELHSSYPQYNVGRHIATSLADYGDMWGITDKEFVYALSKYKAQLDMDISHTDVESEIDDIIRQGLDLANILKEEEDNGDY